MALNVSSSQIYAGRYHYEKPKQVDLFDRSQWNYSTPKTLFREQYPMDTVTFSDEGLAKSKNWREYTKDNPNIRHESINPKDELYKELNTVNNIDTASMFNCELGEVTEQIRKENGFGTHSDSQEQFLTIMAKAYQVVYDRIEEDFSDPDKDPTWIKKEDGTLVEETKQDRIDALNKAYFSKAELAASSAKQRIQLEKSFYGKNYDDSFEGEFADKVMESWQNAISKNNLSRLRQRGTDLKSFSVDLGIDGRWSNEINAHFYGN